MEQLQKSLQDGPCRTAHETGLVVSVVDLAAEGCWPPFQRRAGELGLHAVAAIPLRARDRGWGVLDLYRGTRTPFSPQELAAGRTLALLATSYLVVTADRDSARAAQDELAHRAMHDPLTGLPVRWVLLEQLTHALHRLERHPGHLAVLFLDLDHLQGFHLARPQGPEGITALARSAGVDAALPGRPGACPPTGS